MGITNGAPSWRKLATAANLPSVRRYASISGRVIPILPLLITRYPFCHETSHMQSPGVHSDPYLQGKRQTRGPKLTLLLQGSG